MRLAKILLMVVISVFLTVQAHAQTPPENVVYTEDNCIDGQDLNSADIDIMNCPAIPVKPTAAPLGETGLMINLGNWELGQTA